MIINNFVYTIIYFDLFEFKYKMTKIFKNYDDALNDSKDIFTKKIIKEVNFIGKDNLDYTGLYLTTQDELDKYFIDKNLRLFAAIDKDDLDGCQIYHGIFIR